MVIRCTYFFEIGTSIPIFMYSFRRGLVLPFLEDQSEERIDAFDERYKSMKWASTTILLGAAFGLAQLADLGVILSVAGASFSTINVYIFPSLLILKTGRQGFATRIGAPIILVIGSLCGLVGFLKELDKAGLTHTFGE